MVPYWLGGRRWGSCLGEGLLLSGQQQNESKKSLKLPEKVTKKKSCGRYRSCSMFYARVPTLHGTSKWHWEKWRQTFGKGPSCFLSWSMNIYGVALKRVLGATTQFYCLADWRFFPSLLLSLKRCLGFQQWSGHVIPVGSHDALVPRAGMSTCNSDMNPLGVEQSLQRDSWGKCLLCCWSSVISSLLL